MSHFSKQINIIKMACNDGLTYEPVVMGDFNLDQSMTYQNDFEKVTYSVA